MSRFRHIIALQLVRMTFALAGAVLLALTALSSSVQAGCGDYVFVRNASGRLVRASTLMADHGGQHSGGCSGPHCPDYNPLATQPEADPAPQEESQPINLPCQGPNCSSRSHLPAGPAPPPAPQRSSQESTALLLKSNLGDQESGGRFGSAPASSNQELHHTQFIFHPPR
ncbi:MAG: hypothetical protein IAF94_03830 [Pirellulaceae bacterium]|nr:hypothetical protein [Pirellulaceae bacterium]